MADFQLAWESDEIAENRFEIRVEGQVGVEGEFGAATLSYGARPIGVREVVVPALLIGIFS
jgi:hypothetical protein